MTDQDTYVDPIPAATGLVDARTALRRYQAQVSNEPWMCLKETRTAYGIGSRYPDAATAWAHTQDRHPGDRRPPVGAPVFWTGGSGGYGHVAIYAGDDLVRSSDAGGKGKMGTRPLGWFTSTWGLPYAGWAADLNGVRIPGLVGPPDPQTPPNDTPTWEDPDMVLIQAPTKSWWTLAGGHLCSITAQTAANARAGGVPAFASDSASWSNLVAAYPVGGDD